MIRTKERASALGHLMVGAELSGKKRQLNKGESDRLSQIMLNKDNGRNLTPLMQSDFIRIRTKGRMIIEPELSKGAKTHVRNKWYGHKYDFQKKFSNRFTRNGNEQEQNIITQVGKLLGYHFAAKNEDSFENEFVHGTPDWLTKKNVFDVKCVFEPSGLDFGDELDQLYYWQILCYLWLCNRTEGAVIKVLCNKSEGVIRQAAKVYWEESGNNWFDPIPEDFIDEVRELLNFEGRLPIEERVNFYPVTLEQRHIDLIIQQVNLANEYYNQWSGDVKLLQNNYKQFSRTFNQQAILI